MWRKCWKLSTFASILSAKAQINRESNNIRRSTTRRACQFIFFALAKAFVSWSGECHQFSNTLECDFVLKTTNTFLLILSIRRRFFVYSLFLFQCIHPFCLPRSFTRLLAKKAKEKHQITASKMFFFLFGSPQIFIWIQWENLPFKKIEVFYEFQFDYRLHFAQRFCRLYRQNYT